MKIIMSSGQIRNNWHSLLLDRYFPFPDMARPEEFIKKLKTEKVFIGGAEVILQDELPPLPNTGR